MRVPDAFDASGTSVSLPVERLHELVELRLNRLHELAVEGAPTCSRSARLAPRLAGQLDHALDRRLLARHDDLGG